MIRSISYLVFGFALVTSCSDTIIEKNNLEATSKVETLKAFKNPTN